MTLLFAVVDVETTDFSRSDRMVEVAVVRLTASGEAIEERTTRVGPLRGVGPTHVHGITPAMITDDPTFPDIAHELAFRLDSAVLVARNLPFDVRLVPGEFACLDVRLHPGQGICTYRATGERLPVACARRGIPLDDHHCALTDARATAEVLRRVPRRRHPGRGDEPRSAGGEPLTARRPGLLRAPRRHRRKAAVRTPPR